MLISAQKLEAEIRTHRGEIAHYKKYQNLDAMRYHREQIREKKQRIAELLPPGFETCEQVANRLIRGLEDLTGSEREKVFLSDLEGLYQQGQGA